MESLIIQGKQEMRKLVNIGKIKWTSMKSDKGTQKSDGVAVVGVRKEL